VLLRIDVVGRRQGQDDGHRRQLHDGDVLAEQSRKEDRSRSVRLTASHTVITSVRPLETRQDQTRQEETREEREREGERRRRERRERERSTRGGREGEEAVSLSQRTCLPSPPHLSSRTAMGRTSDDLRPRRVERWEGR
jgi:hypothetical protein